MSKHNILFICFCLLLVSVAGFYVSYNLGIRQGKAIENSRIDSENHNLTMRFIDQKYLTAECRGWAIWKTQSIRGGYQG